MTQPRPADATLTVDRSIVLVGLMGAGKSTVGRRLAAELGLPFADADLEIEAAAGLTIPEIFERFGEPYFRAGERRVIGRLLAGPPAVLGAGGGAFMAAKTRDLIHRRAVSIWLKATLDVLVERCARRGNRPLLADGDPRQILGRLMAERHPVYAGADIVVESGEAGHEAVVAEILRRLPEFAAAPPPVGEASR